MTAGAAGGSAYRRPSHSHALQTGQHNRSTSSHDEYSESSTDDDDLPTSHAPRGGRMSPRQVMRDTGLLRDTGLHFKSEEEEGEYEQDSHDDDENRTALGVAQPVFTPQPNAFSHPPTAGAGLTPRESRRLGEGGEGYFASQHPSARPRFGNVRASTHRAASDAALRASLTTLLSCAQAARSLPKRSLTGVERPTGERERERAGIQGPGLPRNDAGLRAVFPRGRPD